MAVKESTWQILKEGFIRGTGWALGATFGFALVIIFLSGLLKLLGGFPLVGNFLATLVELTQKALEARRGF